MTTENRELRRARAAAERRGESFDGIPRRYLRIKEATHYLNVSVAYVWKIARDGALPLVRIGARTLVDVQDLDALAQRSKSQSVHKQR